MRVFSPIFHLSLTAHAPTAAQARQRKLAGTSGTTAGPHHANTSTDNNAAPINTADKRAAAAGSAAGGRQHQQQQSETNSGSGSSTTTSSVNKKQSATKAGLAAAAAGKKDSNVRGFFVMTRWHVLVGCTCLAIASYFGYVGYLETRVNTPFDDHKVSGTCGGNGKI